MIAFGEPLACPSVGPWRWWQRATLMVLAHEWERQAVGDSSPARRLCRALVERVRAQSGQAEEYLEVSLRTLRWDSDPAEMSRLVLVECATEVAEVVEVAAEGVAVFPAGRGPRL